MLIAIDPSLEAPPYVQIEEQLRAAIERGELRADAPLPTVRQLAGDLGVAPNTVARAYADLQETGWLVSEGRRGTRVAPKPPSQSAHARVAALDTSLQRFFHDLRHRGYTEGEIHEAVRKIVRAGA